ncbi:hypothetical protein CPSG_05052 [Coccidioides posadasii str. Silveira]|uniref:Uncharacterized protein n=1 Tax=Coccidioides posadasii (strain RMSCC 757 / Silveira) TaxID=443226 RepID=E9D622_COCPS|nr:hypothetical protein CPSG_05052 [Coccidioides posadasii str. Silveira]
MCVGSPIESCLSLLLETESPELREAKAFKAGYRFPSPSEEETSAGRRKRKADGRRMEKFEDVSLNWHGRKRGQASILLACLNALSPPETMDGHLPSVKDEVPQKYILSDIPSSYNRLPCVGLGPNPKPPAVQAEQWPSSRIKVFESQQSSTGNKSSACPPGSSSP